jgi:hypothetical protein
MENKGVIDIQLDPIELPRMRDVIDLLLTWYLVNFPDTDTVERTKAVLKLWGRIE